MHISGYHRLIGVLRMYSDVFPLVDKVGIEPTSRGGVSPAFHNATYPYLVVKAGLKPAYNFSVKNSISTFLFYS